MTAARISRLRRIWLAGFVALGLFTFGIVPHASSESAARIPSAPVAAAGSHPDQVVLTRAPSSPVASLKVPATYGDLAIGIALLGLGAWLLAARPRLRRTPSGFRYGPRLSRAPPLAA
ncbi:MAG TPA: hypothetical protein VHZ96_15230 [Frankiaceae bacterium]|nr:hypothetical protein [Frankiaceae bacterium]